jgi:hypothetical protein
MKAETGMLLKFNLLTSVLGNLGVTNSGALSAVPFTASTGASLILAPVSAEDIVVVVCVMTSWEILGSRIGLVNMLSSFSDTWSSGVLSKLQLDSKSVVRPNSIGVFIVACLYISSLNFHLMKIGMICLHGYF